MSWRSRAGIGLAVAMMAVAVPGIAWGQETDAADDARVADVTTDGRPHPCRAIKERALLAIERRLATVDRLQGAVPSNRHLTQAHQAQLEAELASYERGLSGLAEDIEGADCEDLPELVRRIVDDYRIFVLVVPKVHLVIAADTLVDVIERLQDVAERLEEVIDRFEAQGYDVAAAQDELDEMQSQLESAIELADPVPDMVLPLEPEDWPEAGSVFQEAAGMVRRSAASTREAWHSAHQVVQALREAKSS